MLLAEDLLLLLLDDDSGKPIVDGSTLDLALAGAVVLELTERGRLDVSGPDEQVRPGRLVVRDSTATGDAVLDEALDRVTAASPRTPQDTLPKVAKQLRATLLDRLVERGVLRADEGRVLGIFPTRSWPAEDVAHEATVRQGLRDVLVVGRTAQLREAELVSLLLAVDAVHKVLDGDRRELKRRAKEIAEGEFAGAAVRKAVEAVNAAVLAAVIASTVAVGAGTSS